MKTKIVLAGGSGFLGRTLAKWFAERDTEVVVLSRSDPLKEWIRYVQWDGEQLGDWAGELEGASALINLAGRSVDCRYTPKNQRLIMDSRVQSTRVLGEAVRACTRPPALWMNSSTATIYQHTFGAAHDEQGETGAHPDAKDAFSVEVARNWEAAFFDQETPATRKLVLRIAMVFDDEPGTVYAVLRRLARFGLGGKMGSGRQFVSWMHSVDFCRAVHWLLDHPEAEGVYNLSAPNPLSNQEMMAAMRAHGGLRFGLPAAAWMLELGAFLLRTETELIIKSRRVVPGRLLAEGFEFAYPDFEQALDSFNARATS